MQYSVYYHTYLTDDLSCIDLLLSQFATAIDFEVFQNAQTISVTAIGNNGPGSSCPRDSFASLINSYAELLNKPIELVWFDKNMPDSEIIHANSKEDLLDETLTLERLWSRVQDSQATLYFHSKGVTAINKFFNTNNKMLFCEEFRDKLPRWLINTVQWRKFLEWGVLEKYQTCLNLLYTCDTAGVNFGPWPSPHYSGNFWWANNDYIRKLPNPRDTVWFKSLGDRYPDVRGAPRRMMGELWLGSGADPKMMSLFNHPTPPPTTFLGETTIIRSQYVNS